MKESQLRLVLHKLKIVTTPGHSSGWIHAKCPFAPWLHKKGTDNSGSFAVKIEDDGKSSYVCKACKQHGNMTTLAHTIGSYRKEDNDAVAREILSYEMETLAEMPRYEDLGIAPQPPMPLDEGLYEGMFLDPITVPEADAFLEARGVSQATSTKLGLGYDPTKKRITFPVRGMGGELYGWSGRTILPDHNPKVLDYQDLKKRWMVLGVERWQHGKPVLIVEGLFAYAHLHEIGADEHFNIGALLGSSLTEEKAALLKAFDEPIYWMLDDDEAGDDGLFGRVRAPTRSRPFQITKEGEQPEEPEAADTPVVRDTAGSALHMMKGHVPQYVPAYPEGVNDVDDITLEQLLAATKYCPLWVG